jgi:hypothetical protein
MNYIYISLEMTTQEDYYKKASFLENVQKAVSVVCLPAQSYSVVVCKFRSRLCRLFRMGTGPIPTQKKYGFVSFLNGLFCADLKVGNYRELFEPGADTKFRSF